MAYEKYVIITGITLCLVSVWCPVCYRDIAVPCLVFQFDVLLYTGTLLCYFLCFSLMSCLLQGHYVPCPVSQFHVLFCTGALFATFSVSQVSCLLQGHLISRGFIRKQRHPQQEIHTPTNHWQLWNQTGHSWSLTQTELTILRTYYHPRKWLQWIFCLFFGHHIQENGNMGIQAEKQQINIFSLHIHRFSYIKKKN